MRVATGFCDSGTMYLNEVTSIFLKMMMLIKMIMMMMMLMITMIMMILHQRRKTSKPQSLSLPKNHEQDHDQNVDDAEGNENHDDENIKSMMMMTMIRIA